MNHERLRNLVLALLAVVLGGCGALSPMSRPLSPGASGSVLETLEGAWPAALQADETPLRLTSASRPAQAPAEVPAKQACIDAAEDDDFYGFYRTDEWNRGDVVLTFDDGPHPTATPRVLSMLQAHDMKATFFLIGRNINRDTYDLVQRIVSDGHTLGTHSYNHDVHMTRVQAPERTVDYIQAQHEVTLALIDMALMAITPDDFDAMYARVFESKPGTWLRPAELRRAWRGYGARHAALLEERGHSLAERPESVLFSRPPGGGPYVEEHGYEGKQLYNAAMERLGLVNVMWHGASGDTDPDMRSDFAYLTDNLKTHSRRGGVLLIHDYIRSDALAAGLSRMADDPETHVISMEEAVQRKYRCGSDDLRDHLRALSADSEESSEESGV